MSKRTQKKRNAIRGNRSLRKNNKRSIKKIHNKQIKSKKRKSKRYNHSERTNRVQKGGFTGAADGSRAEVSVRSRRALLLRSEGRRRAEVLKPSSGWWAHSDTKNRASRGQRVGASR